MITPLKNHFFQLLGNMAKTFLTSMNLKKSERPFSLLESLNPSKVLWSCITVNLSIVKTSFVFGAEDKPWIMPPDL